MNPESILILGAGFGTRMGALTQNKPKPLIEVGGRPLIDHALDQVIGMGIENVVVNLHYQPDQMDNHLAKYSNVRTVYEQDILETGGGLKNALPVLGSNPVFTLNSDAIWTGKNPLKTLANYWDPDRMDGLLLLIEKELAQEHNGKGDFFLSDDHTLTRRGNEETAPFVYLGAQIIKTDMLESIDGERFSLNLLWDKVLLNNRLFGVVHNGGWVDVGRPEGIVVGERELKRAADV